MDKEQTSMRWNLADEILRDAKNDVHKETVEKLKKRMVGLYRRLAEAKSIVANVEKEIDMAEAEIRRDLADVRPTPGPMPGPIMPMTNQREPEKDDGQ